MPKTITLRLDGNVADLFRQVTKCLGAADDLHAISRSLGLARLADSYAWQEGDRRVLRILTPAGRSVAVALNKDWPAEDVA